MPSAVFHQLARNSPKPEENYEQISFIFNCGRCGSTLMARMIEEADQNSK